MGQFPTALMDRIASAVRRPETLCDSLGETRSTYTYYDQEFTCTLRTYNRCTWPEYIATMEADGHSATGRWMDTKRKAKADAAMQWFRDRDDASPGIR